MPRSTIIVIIAGFIILVIFSLYTFRITDIFLPPTITDSSKKVEFSGANELKIEDIKKGSGREVKSGDNIVIHYEGKLTDGTRFDSSYDRGVPFETQIGIGQVIKGWDQGVIGMKVGGKRKLTIPPELGYGPQSAGNIPPNSTLIFELELIEIK